MHYFVRVDVGYTTEDHFHNFPYIIDRQERLIPARFKILRSLLENIVQVLRARNVLHDDIQVAIVFERLHILDHVIMIKHRHDLDLLSDHHNLPLRHHSLQ